MKLPKLKGRIIEKYGTCRAFAQVLGISESTVSLKLSGKVGFSVREIETWSYALSIKREEYGEFYFV